MDLRAPSSLTRLTSQALQVRTEIYRQAIGGYCQGDSDSKTNKDNLFERASALRFLNIENAIEMHNQSGVLWEQNKPKDLSNLSMMLMPRHGRRKILQRRLGQFYSNAPFITWPEIKAFAVNGHEFGSHSISHPRLAVLDEKNMLYELEKCKEKLLINSERIHAFPLNVLSVRKRKSDGLFP
ncbi:MAG: polysaccharide deacetylase family protein [Chryseolinea sp.]